MVSETLLSLIGRFLRLLEDAVPPPRSQLIVHEVQAPALVGQRQHRGRRPRANGALSSLPATHCQTSLPVAPLGLLAVDRDAIPAQQDMQSSIAEPLTLPRQLAQTDRSSPSSSGMSDTACSCDPLRRQHTPAARSFPAPFEDARLLPASRQASPFFDSRSFRPALSTIVSASNRLSRAFSSSSDRSRFASDTSRPPNLAFQA